VAGSLHLPPYGTSAAADLWDGDGAANTSSGHGLAASYSGGLDNPRRAAGLSRRAAPHRP